MKNKKGFFQKMKMPLPELEAYYRSCRAEMYEKNLPFKGMKWRERMHFLLLAGLWISRKMSHVKLHIVNDQRIRAKGPVIYACTHIGWSDIEMAAAAIKSHVYLFLGDPRELYRRAEGAFLNFNGVIYCDTDSKSDRYIGKELCIRLLQSGGRLPGEGLVFTGNR